MPKHTQRPKRTMPVPLEMTIKRRTRRYLPQRAYSLRESLLGLVILVALVFVGVFALSYSDNQAQSLHDHGLRASGTILDVAECPYRHVGSGKLLIIRFVDAIGTTRTARSYSCVGFEDGNQTTIWYQASDPQTIVVSEDVPGIAERLRNLQIIGVGVIAVIGFNEVRRWWIHQARHAR